MHGTLIKELHNESNQKVYKLDFKVYTSKYGSIKEILKDRKLKEGWKFDCPTDYVDKVMVSDAHTHFERLVFPVVDLVNVNTGKKTQSQILIQIAGEWTAMIHGGDPLSMLEPEEYFEQLYELNKEYN